jgi:hypothetical protein
MDGLVVALLSGLLGGAAVAVVGGLITLVVQRRDHKARAAEAATTQAHERAMAREARLQARRERAYVRILEHCYYLATWVDRVEPFIGPTPDPPPPVPDAELWRLNALTAAHASADVRRLTLALKTAASHFNAGAGWAATDRQRLGAVSTEAREMLTSGRDDLRATLDTLADRINDELRVPPDS